MRGKKAHLDFEVNLIPFIDLLSTCICFLLITAVWLSVGTLNVKQAVGGQSASETEKKPVVWVMMETDGSINLDIKDALGLTANQRKFKLNSVDGKIDHSGIGKAMADIKQHQPDVRTVLIQPKAASNYEDIVDLMDSFKKAGLGDLGVVPL